MKATTYRITLSDKKRIQLVAHSAGQAIEDALWTYRGRTVKECYSGLKQPDVDEILRQGFDKRPIKGHIQHEIPEHEAISESAVRPRPRAKTDATESMFNEAAIKSESARAKEAFSRS